MRDNGKITTLHKEYTKEKTLANIREHKRKRLIRARKTAIIVIGCLVLLLTAWPLFKNHQRTLEYRQQYEQSQEQLAELHEKESDLEYQVTLLENEEYVAKLARSEYHLTKDDEVVFKLPKKLDEELSDEDTTDDDEKTNKQTE